MVAKDLCVDFVDLWLLMRGQSVDRCQRAAARLRFPVKVALPLLVCETHLGKVAEGLQEYGRLDDIRDLASGSGEHCLEVAERLTLERGRISAALAGRTTRVKLTVCSSMPPSITFIVSGTSGMHPERNTSESV